MSSIEKDERLLPLPVTNDLQLHNQPDTPVNYSPIYEDDVFSEGRSLRDYFLVVYKRLPIILALTILVTAAVAFYMYRLPSVYEGQAVMVIEPPKPKATQEKVYINFGYDTNYYNTQLRLLKNPDLMQKVVIKLGLYKDPNLFNKGNKGVIESLRSILSGNKSEENKETLPVLVENTDNANVLDINALPPEEKARVEMYANMLVGALNVEQVNSTDLVNLRLQSYNQELIPRVINTLADLHIREDAKRAVQGSEEIYKDLSNSIETLKGTIAQQESQRIAEMERSNIPVTGEKSADFNATRLSTLSTQFLEAENERRKIQAEYESAKAAIERGEPFGPASKDNDYINKARENILKMRNDLDNRVDNINKQIIEAESKLEQLRVKYTDEHPEVKTQIALVNKLKNDQSKVQKEVSKKIDEEEKKLAKNAGSEILTNLQSKLTAAQRSEAQLRAAYFNEINSAQQRGVDATRLVTLTNEIETNRNLLNTYIQRQKEMELTIQGSRPDNLTVSTYATRPEAPIGPQRNRNIFVAFFLTFAMGIGLAFLLDYLDDSVKTSDDIGKHLGLPTLALIPHQSLMEKRRKGALANKTGVPTTSTALITIEDNRSAMAEAYRHLRTSLLFSSAGKPPQTVLVTSSQPSEGKTTTAINVAITLAQAGADVVIIDCDLRRPRLHSHFAMDNNTGLTNYLSGERNVENLIKTYPGFPKLKVVTSGPIPPNPAELLSSPDMKDILRDLKGKYKHIVIDSPPAISFTDASILATLVDGVILVAMAGKSSIQLIRRFKQRLNSIGARIYGVVLNGIKPDSLEYGYYGYGYEYGYEYEDDGSTPKMEDEYETITRK